MHSDQSTNQIIFIYNARSGPVHTLLDIGHKVISPGTYKCNLCLITHHTLGVKKQWQEFLDTLPIAAVFLHQDELKNSYHHLAQIPAPTIVYTSKAMAKPQVLVSQAQLNQITSLSELITILKQKLLEL